MFWFLPYLLFLLSLFFFLSSLLFLCLSHQDNFHQILNPVSIPNYSIWDPSYLPMVEDDLWPSRRYREYPLTSSLFYFSDASGVPIHSILPSRVRKYGPLATTSTHLQNCSISRVGKRLKATNRNGILSSRYGSVFSRSVRFSSQISITSACPALDFAATGCITSSSRSLLARSLMSIDQIRIFFISAQPVACVFLNFEAHFDGQIHPTCVQMDRLRHIVPIFTELLLEPRIQFLIMGR